MMIDHFKNEWKSLQENKSYKFMLLWLFLQIRKKNYYKVILLVNDGESYGNGLLNSEILHKPNFEEFALFTTNGTNKYFVHTFTRVGNLLFKDENIEKFLKSDK